MSRNVIPYVPYKPAFLLNVGTGLLLWNVGKIWTMLVQHLVNIKKLTSPI